MHVGPELDLSKPEDIQKAFETHAQNERMLAQGIDQVAYMFRTHHADIEKLKWSLEFLFEWHRENFEGFQEDWEKYQIGTEWHCPCNTTHPGPNH